MMPAEAMNKMAPMAEKASDVLHAADSPSSRAMISTPVMMMKPGQHNIITSNAFISLPLGTYEIPLTSKILDSYKGDKVYELLQVCKYLYA